MRTPLIAGNWKMNGSRSQTKALIQGIKSGLQEDSDVEILVLPVFVYLPEAHHLLNQTNIKLGGQDLYPGANGAFTGEVSGHMLKDIGCEYVLIGHSERRTLFHEGLPLVAAKFKVAVEAGLKPILCVGETKQQRENDATETVIREQIESVIELAGIKSFEDAVIAYEPVWAIGTGLTATRALQVR